MLKHCLLNVDYTRVHAQQHLRPKCGEIFYENASSFQLVCYLCEMKHFGFDDFVRHIRNVHFDSQGKPLTHLVPVTAVTASQLTERSSSPARCLTANGNDNYANDNLTEAEEEEENASAEAEADEADDDTPLRIIGPNDDLKSDESETNEASWSPHDAALSSDSDYELDATAASAATDATEPDDETQKQSVFKKQRQPKEYKCEYCARNYTTLKYLNIHLKMSHPHPNGFKCGDCDATFDVERALDAHRRKVHTEFTCKLCAKVYKSSRTLLRHVQGHSGLRQYKCDFENCGKSFVNQHNLTSHRRVHSAERNYVCELCGYRSRYREALIVHRRSHTGEKPFKCETCARCFASKSLLNEHQAMHSTERPYKCDKCEAAFSRPKALYHHKHLHLGIKKFKCKICGNAYAQAAGLSAHMRGHKLQASNGIVDGGEIAGMELLFSY